MTKLAEVFVQVRLDTSGITAEAEKSGTSAGNAAEGGFMRAFKARATAKIGADTTKAKAEIDDLKRRIARIGGKSAEIKARVALETAQANAKVADLKGELLALNRAKVDIKGDTSDIDADIARVKAEIEDISQGRTVAKANLALDTAKAKTELAFLKAELEKYATSDYTATAKINVTEANKGFSALVTAGIALGPALLPVLGASTVAVGALGSGLSAAGGAAGAFGLSVIGQIKAMTTAQASIKTTTTALAGLAKGTPEYAAKLKDLNAQQKSFDKTFGPAAKGFDAMRTAFDGFQQATSKVTLGVMGKALQGVAGILPKLAPLANAAGTAIGGLVDDFVGFTKGATFGGVLTFFQRTGPAAITAFGKSIGNVAVGFGGILAAFAPMQGGVLSGLESITAKFASWGQSLGSSSGFAKFMDYVKSTLPDVMQLIGNLATAIGHIVVAMAPLGKIELGGLNAFLDTINSLPTGVLTVAAGALTAFAIALKAVAVAEALQKGAGKLGLLSAGVQDVGAQAGTATSKLKAFATSSVALRGGALIAGVALNELSGKLRDSNYGLSVATQAAGDAAIGFAVGGPLGAAVGAGVGLWSSYNTQVGGVNTALSNLNAAMQNPVGFKAQNAALFQTGTALQTFTKNASTLQTVAGYIPVAGSYLSAWFGHKASSQIDATNQKTAEATAYIGKNRRAFSDLTNVMSNAKPWTDYTNNTKQLTATATAAVPVLTKMGLTLQDVTTASILGKGAHATDSWKEFVANFKATNAELQSAQGRADAVGASLSHMGDGLSTAAGNAQSLTTALQGAFGPSLALVGSTDQFNVGLRHMSDNLAKGNRQLTGNTDAAAQNRAAIGGQVTAMQNMNVAQAAAGKTGRQLAFSMKDSYNAIIRQGVAAGFTRQHMVAYLGTLGLTPKFISTQLRAVGITAAQSQARGLAQRYKALPDNVQTYIKAHGIPTTAAAVAKLKGRFKDLSNADVRTLVALQDKASGPVARILGRILHLNGAHAHPKVTVETRVAHTATSVLTTALNLLGGKTAKPKVTLEAQVAKSATAGISRAISVLNGKSAKPKVTVDAGPSVAQINKVQSQLAQTDHSTATPKINVKSNAPQISGDAKRSLASVHDVTPKINVSTNAASVAGGARASMQIPDSYATIHINTVRSSSKQADGGYITGPGGPRDDLIPALLSNGEFVVNAAATARNLAELHAMNAQTFHTGGLVRMADGGKAHHHTPTPAERKAAHKAHAAHEHALEKGLKHFDHGFDVSDTRSETRSDFQTLLGLLKDAVGKHSPLVKHLAALGDKLVAAQKAQDKAQNAWQKQVDKLDKIKSEAADYRKTVQAAFTHDAFGGSLHDLNLQERADTNDARAAKRALAQAKHRGLGGKGGRGLLKELMASGNVALIEQFSHLSHAEIQHEEALYRARQRATGNVGSASAHDVYGKSIREQTHEVKHLHKVLERLNHHLNELEHRVERGARQGVHDGTKDHARRAGAGRKGHHH